MYGGGNAGYVKASNDFELFLGMEEEIGERRGGVMRVTKLRFEGTAQPAESLDELLKRIEQSKS